MPGLCRHDRRSPAPGCQVDRAVLRTHDQVPEAHGYRAWRPTEALLGFSQSRGENAICLHRSGSVLFHPAMHGSATRFCEEHKAILPSDVEV